MKKSEINQQLILAVVNAYGPMTLYQINEHLVGLKLTTLRKYVDGLRSAGTLISMGRAEKTDDQCQPTGLLYAYNPDIDSPVYNPGFDLPTTVRYRNQKIAAVESALDRASEYHRDLLIGVLNDYRVK